MAAAASAAAPMASAFSDDAWSSMINRVSPSVCVVRMFVRHAFEGGPQAYVSEGTGFIVDSERGLILTNRHIVTIGVTSLTAQIGDEEVDVTPIYRDPVHDFGLLRFNPANLKFGVPAAIPLRPEACRVGAEIRIIGNDAGERRQVLSAAIARLDRNCPNYGRLGWNDANTFYIGAASNTSGGSSGSPVLNIRGEAVGINAGGATSAASAMYLPLWPAVRALERLRRGEYVPRGDCHTIFTHKRFHEVLRSGVPPKVVTEVKEAGMRAHVEAGGSEGDADAGATGMLEVSHVLRGGVSARGSRAYDKVGVRRGFLQPGDVVFKVNGTVVSAFWPVEQAMDAAMEALCEKEAVISAKRSRGSTGAGAAAAAGRGTDEGEDEDDEGDALQAPWTSVRLLGEAEEGEADDSGVEDGGPRKPVAADDDSFLRALNAAGETATARPTSLPAPKTAYAPATGPRPTADDPDCPAGHPAAASNGREALGKIRFTIVRAGRILDVDIPVVDAHALVPRRVLQIGGAGIAELSVIRSINNGHPQGVCVINPPGFVFADVGKDVVLRGIDGHEVTCLADAAAALAVVREDSYFSVTVSDLHSPAGARRSVVCYMTRRFHPARILSRHVADDCAAEGDSPSRWLETAMPSLQLAIAGADGEAEVPVSATDDDAASLPGTGPVLPAAARALVMEAVTDALGDYDLSPEALGGGGLADGVPDDGSEGGDVDDGGEATGSSPGDEGDGGSLDGEDGVPASGDADEEEDEEDEEEGEDIDFEFDPGALLATAATKGGPAARAELEGALRKALDQAGVQSQDDGEDGIGAMVDAIMAQAQAAMAGASKARGRPAQRATAEDSKAMAEAIREQRLASLEKAPKPVQDAAMALVGIECRLPLQIDGVETGGLEAMMGMGSAAAGNVSHGRGVVVDSDLGIVLVDRAIVPVFMAIVHVVMGVARVPARVLFVSPSSTFALIQADLSGRSESGGLRLADAIKAVHFGSDDVGLRDMTLERKAAKKAGAKDAVWFLSLDETGGVNAAQDDVFQAAQNVATALPEYAGQAFEAYRIVNTVGYGVMSEPGIAVNAKGEIVAMISEVGGDSPLAVSAEWLKEPVTRVIRRIKEGTSATLSDLGVQLEFVALADAQAALGMPARRAAALMNNTVESEVIVVAQVVAGSAAGERFGLRERDVLLEVLPDSWPEPDDDPTSMMIGDSDSASEDGEAATKRAVTAAASAEPTLARSVLAALGMASASPPRPTYKDDLTEPLPIRSAADVILRCRLRSSVRLRVLRDGREVCVTARTDPVEVRGASKVVVQWQGMTMTPPDVGLLRRSGVPWVGVPPHRSSAAASAWNNGASTPHKAPAAERAAIAMQGSGLQAVPSARGKAQADGVERVDVEARLPAGVVCCFTESGSEASAQLGQAYWVLKINETPVPTLDDVLYVTSRLPERTPVTVTLGEILNGQTKIITLRPDSAALPLLRFVHGERFQWRREVVTGPWSPGSAALQRQSSLSVGPGTFGASTSAHDASKSDTGSKDAPSVTAETAAWVAGGLAVAAGAAGLVAMLVARSRAASSPSS
ncbi:hypothetical protein FNF29_06315 [Cafeteria roenbergensis]|uniref:PDZ domain-containing protein n=1 Tax=Cafeteria roenbergensis TaxID=33653 RepID=A0A5A8C8Z7_CAFRO|nr:hypothetical protein FNF29_06315 [Cafeteria roenbergensis]|eukprot:KAA0149024.1 hypothetical protein FNF29_06315 [Cafeteria roenbergensis]